MPTPTVYWSWQPDTKRMLFGPHCLDWIHTILPVQFTCLTIFFAQPVSLVYLLIWSLCLILHTFLYLISVFFLQHMPHTIAACFCCSTKIISSIPSLSQHFTWDFMFYLNITHLSLHSHLCSLKCTSFSFLRRQVSLPCSILLHTQLHRLLSITHSN